MIAIQFSTTTATITTTEQQQQRQQHQSPKYWPRYGGKRHVQLLDGLWNMSQLPITTTTTTTSTGLEQFDSMDPHFDPNSIPTLNLTCIPSTVDNTLPGYLGYRGVSFFRTIFRLPTDLPVVSSSTTSSSSQRQDQSLEKTTTTTTITTTASPGRIQFQACSFYCRVWVNGIEIGDHKAGGYVPFFLEVPVEVLLPRNDGQMSSRSSENNEDDHDDPLLVELFVLVDNRFNETTAPLHTGGDFWHYGGILRSVEWHTLPPPSSSTSSPSSSSSSGSTSSTSTTTSTSLTTSKTSHDELWPWRLYIFPQPDLMSISLELHLTDSDYDGIILSEIAWWFDDDDDDNNHEPSTTTTTRKTRHVDESSTTNGITTLPFGTISTTSPGIVNLGIVHVPYPRIWSTHDPQLHTITILMNGATVQERFGLRYWDIQDGRIRLNYEILKLVGWNHHTQWPDTGASPTDEQIEDDIHLLQAGNINFIRGAHYPQDPRWLDRLDEVGFIMWSETLGPQVSVQNLQDEYFLHYQEEQIHEMVNGAMNHPSIAFWGFFNEGPSGSIEACPGYQASSQILQQRDPTRFITYASNVYPPHDVCYDAATVISHNGYPGWYQRNVDPAKWWNRIANDLKAGKPQNALGKPFLISETGASGIYEWINSTMNDTKTLWTIPYQTEIIRQDVENAIYNTNISGIALWHFFDFKVDDQWENNTHCDYLPNVVPPTCGYIHVNTSTPSGRPGGMNHKGVLDFFRRPKPAYTMVAERYANVTKKEKKKKSSSPVVTDSIKEATEG